MSFPGDVENQIPTAAVEQDHAYAQLVYDQEQHALYPSKADATATATVAQIPVDIVEPTSTTPVSSYYGTAGSRSEASRWGVPSELPAGFVTDRELRMQETWSLGRSIRFLALLDGFFLFFDYFAYYPIVLLAFFWGPYSGYIAGKDFSVKGCKLYVCYYVLRVISDFAIIWAFVPTPYWMIFNLLIDFFILTFVRKYLRMLEVCSDNEIEELQNDLIPQDARRAYFLVF